MAVIRFRLITLSTAAVCAGKLSFWRVIAILAVLLALGAAGYRLAVAELPFRATISRASHYPASSRRSRHD